MPQVRGTVERFVSRVISHTRRVVCTRPLEALVIGAYVRGLSERDIQSLAEAAGLGSLPKSMVSELCRELRARYRAFCARDLSGSELLALFLDAVYLRTRPRGEQAGVLVSWGYTGSGRRELVTVRLGQRERYEDWLDMGRGLTLRGLRLPGSWSATGRRGCSRPSQSSGPRPTVSATPCTASRTCWCSSRTWASCVPRCAPPTGRPSTRPATRTTPSAGCRHWSASWSGEYPSAAACLADDLPALCAHLRYPLWLRRRLRSSNLLERSLREVQRRVKVIGRFPGVTSCLSLTWAVLDLFIAGAHGLGLSELDQQQRERLREERNCPPEPLAESA